MSLNFILILNVIILSLKWAYPHILLVIYVYIYTHTLHNNNINNNKNKFVMGVFPLQNWIDFVVPKGVATDNDSLYERLLMQK